MQTMISISYPISTRTNRRWDLTVQRLAKGCIVTFVRRIVLLTLPIAALIGYAAPILGQENSATQQSASVVIDYVEPRDEKLLPIFRALKQRKLLEHFQELLSPFRLRTTIRLKTVQCGVINAYYRPSEWAVNLCYEYIQSIEDRAPSGSASDGFVRQDIIAGDVAGIMLHEIGHAIFDNFQVPILGREEDAADEFSAYMALQFGNEVALTIINGRAYHFYIGRENPARLGVDLADEHSMNIQRLQNYICLAYGAKPDAFKAFIDDGPLPKNRSANCAAEYQRIKAAFDKTILPFIDTRLMAQVQSTNWLASLRGR